MLQDTPIDRITIKNKEVYVKREDLACTKPGPPFAKVRGLYPLLKKLKADGVEIVGYMETTVSMAGWGISYFCEQLGMKAVIFKPVYKKGGNRHNQDLQDKKWRLFNAKVIDIQATRLSIMFYQAKRILLTKYPDAFMLPQGLPFQETITEVSAQIVKDKCYPVWDGTIVSCVGSGTMAAGILRGLSLINTHPDYYGIFVAPKNKENMYNKILGMANINSYGFFPNKLTANVRLSDLDYEYTEVETCDCPFPCNIYYDRKAWKFLIDNIKELKEPILFWNIGA